MEGASTLIDVVQNPRPLDCIFEEDVHPKPIFHQDTLTIALEN